MYADEMQMVKVKFEQNNLFKINIMVISHDYHSTVCFKGDPG